METGLAGSFILKTIAKELSKAIFNYVKNHKSDKINVLEEQDIENALITHADYVSGWAYSQIFTPKRYKSGQSNKYVSLTMSSNLRRRIFGQIVSHDDEISSEELLKTENNIIILGDPGSGKTSTLKYICRHLLTTEDSPDDSAQFPLLIQLGKLKEDESLFHKLSTILSLSLNPSLDKDWVARNGNDILKSSVINLLKELQPRILLDGFDEIPNTNIDRLMKEIDYLSTCNSPAKFVLTSRHGIIEHKFPNSILLEILPLNDEKVKELVSYWFANSEKESKFLEELNASPFKDTSDRPLLIVNLCTLFDIHNSIPNNPISIYRKLIELLLDEWNRMNFAKRTTKYTGFLTDQKADFLGHLAYILKRNNVSREISEEEIKRAYHEINECFCLPPKEVNNVIKEIESHNGLIMKSSATTFEFSHYSLREYLVADYLIKSQVILDSNNLDILSFQEELAIAVGISSRSSFLLGKLLMKFSKSVEESKNKYENNLLNMPGVRFVNRLLLEKPMLCKDDWLGAGSLAFISTYFFKLIEVINKISNSDRGKNYVIDLNNYHYKQSIILSYLTLNEQIINSINRYYCYYTCEQNVEFNIIIKYQDKEYFIRKYKMNNDKEDNNSMCLPNEIYVPEYIFHES